MRAFGGRDMLSGSDTSGGNGVLSGEVERRSIG